MFYKSKKDGLTFDEWEQSWKALKERFQIFSDFINSSDLYRFNMSSIQALKIIYRLEVDIKKNQKRIFEMQGFGKRLVEVMTDQMVSQLQLSRELNLTQPQIHYYRKGHSTPRPIMRQKLATSLNVDYLWLSWGIGEKKYYKSGEYPEKQLHLTLGERITFALMIGNHSIEAISQNLAVTHSGFQYWMEGKRKPNFGTIRAIAKNLHVDYDWLKGSSENPSEPQNKSS